MFRHLVKLGLGVGDEGVNANLAGLNDRVRTFQPWHKELENLLNMGHTVPLMMTRTTKEKMARPRREGNATQRFSEENLDKSLSALRCCVEIA